MRRQMPAIYVLIASTTSCSLFSPGAPALTVDAALVSDSSERGLKSGLRKAALHNFRLTAIQELMKSSRHNEPARFPLISGYIGQATRQTFDPCVGRETEVALLGALQIARENLENSGEADKTQLRAAYVAALKAFSDHICGNVKGGHVMLLVNDRRVKSNWR